MKKYFMLLVMVSFVMVAQVLPKVVQLMTYEQHLQWQLDNIAKMQGIERHKDNYNLLFMNEVSKYLNLYVNRFEYVNLPDTIPSDVMENYIFNHGNVIFFKDKAKQFERYLTLPMSASSIDIYSRTIQKAVQGKGYRKDVTLNDSVMIKDNVNYYPMYKKILPKIQSIVSLELTRQTRANIHRHPLIFKTDEKEKDTIRNVIADIYSDTNCKPIKLVDKNVGIALEDRVKVVDSVYINDKIIQEKKNIKNEILTLMGINNIDVDKKERLITGEAEENNHEITENLNYAYDMRVEAFDKINKMFSLDIRVNKKNIQEVEEETDDSTNEL